MNNREVKYRAWDKKTGRMFTVAGIFFDTGDVFSVEDLQTGYQHGLELEPAEVSADFTRKLNDVELMQYTGIKDKNGNPIYEKDIVQRECGVGYKSKHYPSFGSGTQTVSKFVVEFDVEEAAFSKLRQHGDSEFSTTFEVIGNICEDAYLLEDAV